MLRPPTVARTVIQDARTPEPAVSRPMGSQGPTRSVSSRSPGRRARLAGAVLVAAMASSCANLSVKSDSATSGTFSSTARSFTFLSWDMPRPAIQVAHENASDTGLPNLQATSVKETDWGWFDWVLEIIGSRSASVRGTWGFTGE